MSEREEKGLLFAAMEPSPGLEEEFQQWYDTEHFPERQNTKGFLTAARFVCLDGFPRYLALYDLEGLAVLTGPDYAKIAGENYSRWTAHVVPRVWGHYRAAGRQIFPGDALLGDNGSFSRLVVWRFRQAPPSAGEHVVSGLRRIYENRAETAQIRVFEAAEPDGVDFLGLIELYAPWTPPPGSVTALASALRYADMINVYARYARRWDRLHIR